MSSTGKRRQEGTGESWKGRMIHPWDREDEEVCGCLLHDPEPQENQDVVGTEGSHDVEITPRWVWGVWASNQG